NYASNLTCFNLMVTTTKFLTEQRNTSVLNDFSSMQKKYKVQSDDVAYIIYTSGSTGNPKGVVVTHEGIVNFLKEQIKVFQVNSKSRILQYLSIGFDASISEIGISLLSGAEVRIESDLKIKDTAGLINALEKEQITHICLPPSLLPVLDIDRIPSSLETIIIGGEVCPLETVREWASKVRIVNVYGPTEATVCSSLIVCEPNWSKPLIGYPIPNRELFILDEDLKEAKQGELYLSGVGLAKEYLHQEKLTEEKFLLLNGKRLYKTGDRVVSHGRNEIEFIGRMDRQFKLRGNLIEPCEVERLLAALPRISFAYVMKQKLKRDILVAYIVLKNETPIERKEISAIKNYLKKELPYWMVPERFVILNEIPLNMNEKLDLKSFPPLDMSRPSYLPEIKRPITDKERILCIIFEKLLCVEPIGIDDDFFLLGGDSISMLSLYAECSLIGITLSGDKFIQKPTVAGILEMNKTEKLETTSVTFLEKEVRLKEELNNLIRNSNKKQTRCSKILLTGATGFLGSRILFELSQDFEAKIYCVVRNSSGLNPKTKIESILTRQGVGIKNWDNVYFMEGDISEPRLGLSSEDWNFLTINIDSVFHFAAEVNLIMPYEELKKVNVNGTFEILKFCLTGNYKFLHYASTLSVFVSSDDTREKFYEEDQLNSMKEVYGGYAQSKWVSEKIIHNAMQEGYESVNIYRFGLITGDSKTGFGKTDDFLIRFLKSLANLNKFPKIKSETMKVDITPIDFAAKSCIALSHSAANKHIFHIANPKSLTFDQLLNILREYGISLDEVSIEDYFEICKSLGEEDSYLYLSISRGLVQRDEFTPISTLDLFQATGVQFDFANTSKSIPDYFNKCPVADRNLIFKYLDQLGIQA
ncbi:MAG: thioester reductase domain-containing protein, partial [Leptospiraceae bacterium]|nr:thioester reductase domain-containing protein [Leptospiraceae bacterium]